MEYKLIEDHFILKGSDGKFLVIVDKSLLRKFEQDEYEFPSEKPINEYITSRFIQFYKGIMSENHTDYKYIDISDRIYVVNQNGLVLREFENKNAYETFLQFHLDQYGENYVTESFQKYFLNVLTNVNK